MNNEETGTKLEALEILKIDISELCRKYEKKSASGDKTSVRVNGKCYRTKEKLTEALSKNKIDQEQYENALDVIAGKKKQIFIRYEEYGTIRDLEDAYGCGIITESQYQKAIKKFEPSANSIHVQEVYRQAKEYAEDFLYQIHDDNGPVKKKDEMVKVIRCKDCKNNGHCSFQDTFDLVGMRGNGFCSAGKKK